MTWDRARASADEFEALVGAAIDDLPEEFRSRLGSVAIVIDEEASVETLQRMGVHGLFGLYEGVPRTAWGADNAPVPSKITIFRRPLEAYNPSPALLARAVRDTVFHEIAHHFGITDERLNELSQDSARGAR
jgi:predicted Zn-dependent protease with MMP-like domain